MTPPRAATDYTSRLGPEALAVGEAMALLWSHRSKTNIHEMVTALQARTRTGHAFNHERISTALAELHAEKLVISLRDHPNYIALQPRARSQLYAAALAGRSNEALLAALARADPPWWQDSWSRLRVDGDRVMEAQLRSAMLMGADGAQLAEMKQRIQERGPYMPVLRGAILNDFDPLLFERVVPAVRWQTCALAMWQMVASLDAALKPACDWGFARFAAGPKQVPDVFRLDIAEHQVWCGDEATAELAVADVKAARIANADVHIAAIRAALLVRAGRFADAATAFAPTLDVAAPRGALATQRPSHPSWTYLLALLANSTPPNIAKARKLCAARTGPRATAPDSAWAYWTYLLRARAGEVALTPAQVEFEFGTRSDPNIDDLWRLLAIAWSGEAALNAVHGRKRFLAACSETAKLLQQRASQCGLNWLAELAVAANAIIAGHAPSTPFFVRAGNARWRDVLQELRALEQPKSNSTTAAKRLLWNIELTEHGGIAAISAYEQKHGSRGWGKPNACSLARVANSKDLNADDAKVARSIRKGRARGSEFALDRAAAAASLIGHPNLVFGYDFDTLVELRADTAELEVRERADEFSLQLHPPLHAPEAAKRSLFDRFSFDPPAPDAEALRGITIIRDTPQRARLVRYSSTQLRVATLLDTEFKVPAEGRDELQQTLSALALHFRVHADSSGSANTQAAETRLRAELSPNGDGLRLRLVAAPLGIDGPRLQPGEGRARLLATVAGVVTATERLLAEERSHLAAVLDALPQLEFESESPAPCEWLIDDAEAALETVEGLPKLDAIAGIDWPKGKPVRLRSLDLAQLQIRVVSQRDWFEIDGELTVDESAVLGFEQLLAAAHARSRYVAMGDGLYAALSRALKQRLVDLAAIIESDRRSNRIAKVGAAWLRDLLDGAVVDADKGFRSAIDALQRAQTKQHALPSGLQTELRPYQEDGFRWAMRLAEAGIGGCLADDMGLGKTLQALAVLLARGRGGAALVVAPTSVCGNWIDEAKRFAPALQVIDYASAARTKLLARAAPMTVVVTSYALLLQNKKEFAAHHWHSLIVDEAQAIKNPTAKRSIALFELNADFRLALSGTPVENRLAELWSILRFSTPGLLGTLNRFNERFAGPIERARDREALGVLRRLIAPFVLRRTKAQVLQELPARTETLINVVPDADEAAHYEALRREATAVVDAALDKGTPTAQMRFNILAQLMRLRRAACDPRLISPQLAAGEKLQVFLRIAADLIANGHKALVFSQFVDFLALLRTALDENGIHYQTLDGSTPAAERNRRVAAFQAGDGDLFLISLKAGGVGLNLTAADYVVITDPWWNPAAEDQASARAHRIGQQRPVTVYRLVSAGTIEERIVDLHREKREIAEGILESGDVAALPSTDVLIGLMRG